MRNERGAVVWVVLGSLYLAHVFFKIIAWSVR